MKSLTQNDKKLLKAGEYMEIFKEAFEKKKYEDNFKFAD